MQKREVFTQKQSVFTPREPPLLKNTDAQAESKKSVLDRQVQLTISPRNFFKNAFLGLLLLAIFFAGRWSVDAPVLEFELETEEGTMLEPAAPVEEKEASSTDKGAEKITAAAAAEVSVNGEPVEEAAESAEKVEEVSEPEEEVIITNYQRVAFSVDKVRIDWKGTWGRITHVDITIKNNEEGTIKPDHLVLHVKGYDDLEKKVPLPISATSISKGDKVSLSPALPSGFSYNQATTGDLKTVRITATLFDKDEKVMSSFSNDFDLSG